MAEIEVFQNHPSIKIAPKPLKELAQRVLRLEQKTGFEVQVSLTGDAPVKALNKRWRGKDKATDVLSFNFNEDRFLGEVIISLDRAKAQAIEFGVTLKAEVERLTVHGILHLIGYRHHKKADRLDMQSRENRYLKIRK
ncbi:MAG: rRNA maturation RNase YbeY [Fibrobacteres bacterium]|nr:rRNA maturation RNase YbeY [Fibrobacterota bacterium]